MARFEIKTDFGTFEVNADNEQLAMQAALMQGGQQMRDRAMNLFSATQPQAPERIREMASRPPAPKQDIGKGEAFGRSAFDTFYSNIAGIPDLVASIAANAPAMRGAANATGMQLPQIGQRGIVPGIPETEDIMAVGQLAGESAGALATGNMDQFTPFSQAKGQQQEKNIQAREQNPAFSFLGDILGDAATLATLRAPIAKGRTMQHIAAKPVDMAFGKAAESAFMKPGARRAMTRWFAGDNAQTFYNRIGRIAETGLEGAVLTYLSQEDDPLRTAAYAAGGQAAGSMALGLATMVPKAGLVGAGTTILAAAGIWTALAQFGKTITPGGNNYILPSIESAFDKVAIGMGLGVLAGIAGAGRFTNQFAEDFPRIADSVTSSLRGATISGVNKVIQNSVEGDGRYESVINKLQSDPMYFGEAASNRLARSAVNGKFLQEIDNLMKNRTFKSKFEAMD